jgi:hypothetical protein
VSQRVDPKQNPKHEALYQRARLAIEQNRKASISTISGAVSMIVIDQAPPRCQV